MSAPDPGIRVGRAEDLEALTRIYNHYVLTSHVTFDLTPFETEQRRGWFEQFSTHGTCRLFVLDHGKGPVGYACSTPFKDRPAYRISVETSVYLDTGQSGRGEGFRLLRRLLDALAGSGVHGAYAGVALPNEPSERLHSMLGYRRVGVLTEVGQKFDRYWDVAWYEKRIGAG